MKYLRFKHGGEVFCGVAKGETVTRITDSFLGEYSLTGDTYHIDDIQWECPTSPSKVVCIGLNYRDHIDEFGGTMKVPDCPVIFLKPPTACLPHKGSILLPMDCERTDLEAELAVVIGRTCKNVSALESKDYILGYSCINDVTARDFQQADVQWTRAKGFDTFCPYGPYVTPMDDPGGLCVRSYLNGEIKQNGTTADMMFDVFQLVSFVSGVMTLLPGDVIATGTPMGIAQITDGDVAEIEIEGVGRLTNTVRAAR